MPAEEYQSDNIDWIYVHYVAKMWHGFWYLRSQFDVCASVCLFCCQSQVVMCFKHVIHSKAQCNKIIIVPIQAQRRRQLNHGFGAIDLVNVSAFVVI